MTIFSVLLCIVEVYFKFNLIPYGIIVSYKSNFRFNLIIFVYE